jgi:hypothetical protein
MVHTDDADAIAARLWLRWMSAFVHDVRVPISVMGGYLRIMAKGEANPEKLARYVREAQLSHARLVDYLTAAQQCSQGRATTVPRLIESLQRMFTSSVSVKVTGCGDAPVPSDCLGIALWLLLIGQRAAASEEDELCVRLEVHATDTSGRIALAPEDSAGEWRRIDSTDVRGWWLEDVVDYLTMTGSIVDAFCRGNAFSLEITWTRMG